MQIDRDVAIYLAGLFDGEGCVHWNNGIRIRIAMTHKETIEFIQSKTGGSIYITLPKGANKESYSWQVGGKDAQDFVDSILPYSITKSSQLTIAKLFFDTSGRWAERPKEVTDFIIRTIKELNN